MFDSIEFVNGGGNRDKAFFFVYILLHSVLVWLLHTNYLKSPLKAWHRLIETSTA